MKRIFSLIVILNITLSTVYGQRVEYDRSGSTEVQNGTPPIVTQSFKLSPLMLFSGDLPLFYEKQLNESFSIELGVGVTFRNYLHEFWEVIEEQGNTSELDFEARNAKLGFSLRLAPRYYFNTSDYQMSGIYISPEFMFRNYNMTKDRCERDAFNQLIGGTEDDIRNTMDLKLHVGLNDIFENRLIADYFIGLGVRHTVHHKAECVFVFLEDETIVTTYRYWSPIISLGAKIGLGR